MSPSVDKTPDQAKSPRILAGGSVNGHRLELLEIGDGSIVITCDGVEHAIYPSGACNLESCTKAYLEILRSLL